MKLSEDIINSFKDNKEGLGAKRLTAFNIMALITLWHLFLAGALIKVISFDKFKLLASLAQFSVTADYILLALLLSIITVPQIIELKNGSKSKDNEPKQPEA